MIELAVGGVAGLFAILASIALLVSTVATPTKPQTAVRIYALVSLLIAGPIALLILYPTVQHALALRAVHQVGGTVFYSGNPTHGVVGESHFASMWGEVTMISLEEGAANDLEPWRLSHLPELKDLMICDEVDRHQLHTLLGLLQTHPSLESATFHISGLTNQDMKAIAELPLKTLLIGSTSLRSLDLRILEQNASLETLWLAGPDAVDNQLERLGRDDLAALIEFPQLRQLFLINFQLEQDALSVLCQLRHLEWLRFSAIDINDEQLTLLKKSLPNTAVYGAGE